GAMQTVLIDTFVVPKESKSIFLDRSRQVQSFLRTLPGFVEGFLHEKVEGSGRFNVVTTAVWESEAAYEKARTATAEEFQKTGFNPQETMKGLKVEVERAVFRRSPY
ncbi:MAG TPA: antibiotic biosynthesis monooxygenase family protein, partial [Candidatus Eremiobacteraceae bacterium]|nr:antibiotic biosynthesis monooxygenase family protein [Candidatus Eremiobacteraceae bacterium]